MEGAIYKFNNITVEIQGKQPDRGILKKACKDLYKAVAKDKADKMKTSNYLHITAVLFMLLAIFIQSGEYPEAAYALRIIVFAAGFVSLIAGSRAERAENKKADYETDKPFITCSNKSPSGEKNYSSEFKELYEKYCK